jgi:uncharacterized membrane protein
MPRRGRTALAVLLSIAFLAVAHAALADRLPPRVGAIASLVPLALFSAWLVRRSRARLAFVVGAWAIAVPALLAWGDLDGNFAHLFFAEHAGANLLLAIVFGRTLFAGREPLVAIFARIVHGTIPPEVERYTRKVTVAWTAFFASLFLLSCALYLGGLREAWSLFANLATPLLVVAMFVVEYAVRLRTLPHWERVGILGGVRAFSRHFTAPAEAPR